MFLSSAKYQGPYQCWKCKAKYLVNVENEDTRSMVPVSEEEFAEQREIHDLKRKYQGGDDD
jgi:hypothetical protein